MFIVVGLNVSHVDAAITTKTTYEYHSNKKVKVACYSKYNNNVLVHSDCYRYDQNGKTLNLYQRDFAKNKKLLKEAAYNYRNNKRYLFRVYFYYNTHTNNKTPLNYKYATSYYDNNGKFQSTTYHTREGKQAQIVAVAKAQNGKRYRAGGNTPKGFDCSGLTSYVYKTAINKNIGRASYNQTKQGYYVSVNTKTLKPGDILFWGSKSNPCHVGIYIGNGKYIHASTPRTGVKIQTLSSYKPSYAKRMV